MAEQIQSASWPGVVAVAGCTYVCSHGITPGRAVLTTFPQTARPAAFGDLVFTDGPRTVRIPNCKVETLTVQAGADGQTFTLEIVDERWQWQRFGGLSGVYNQKDNRGKLVPWTIRSPRELAAICLSAMGVRGGRLELPQGLTFAVNKVLERRLALGENFPQTLTNPEVVWNRTPPGEALAQLADTYGARVVYQPLSRAVSVLLPGTGKPLPAGPVETQGGALNGSTAPAFVGVTGAPTKIQARFALEPVGEEWDGSIVPINLLSYSPPTGAKQNQISRLFRYTSLTDSPIVAVLEFTDPKTGERVLRAIRSAQPGDNRLDVVKAGMLRDPAVAANFTLDRVTVGEDSLYFKAASHFPFTLRVSAAYAPSEPGYEELSYLAQMTRAATNPLLGSWARSVPPRFPTVQPTERLSFVEAQQKAIKSVFKWFRIVNREPSEVGKLDKPGKPITLPLFGPLVRRQQVILQNSKVEQVKPKPRVPGAIDKNNPLAAANPGIPGQGVLPEFYNGYSRDQANTVTGSVWRGVGSVNWTAAVMFAPGNSFNTDPGDKVFADFTVNPEEQLVMFSEPVWRFVDAGGFPETWAPELILEAGCFVLDATTGAPLRYEETLRVPGGVAPTEWVYREDVTVGVYGVYDEKNRLEGWNFDGAADAKGRAGYYLRGAAARYKLTGSDTRTYPAIVVHEPDGYTQQITWSVGGGATTVISANTEHNPAVPTYPARRRAENLPPDKAAAAVNMVEREKVPTAKDVRAFN